MVGGGGLGYCILAKILLKHKVVGLREALPSRKIKICAQRVVVKIKYYEICFKPHRVVEILIMSVISTRL